MSVPNARHFHRNTTFQTDISIVNDCQALFVIFQQIVDLRVDCFECYLLCGVNVVFVVLPFSLDGCLDFDVIVKLSVDCTLLLQCFNSFSSSFFVCAVQTVMQGNVSFFAMVVDFF